MDEEKFTSEESPQTVDMGDLYSINKQVYAKLPNYSSKEVISKLKPVARWLEENMCEYAMLLCHERRDYTILHYSGEYGIATLSDLRECLENRGRIVDISYIESQDAWEIWLRIGNEVYMFMFFDAEGFVVEV